MPKHQEGSVPRPDDCLWKNFQIMQVLFQEVMSASAEVHDQSPR
jgi:hypothetical protein